MVRPPVSNAHLHGRGLTARQRLQARSIARSAIKSVAELHRHVVSNTGATVSPTAWTQVSLNDIVQGDTDVQRSGDEVVAARLGLRLMYQPSVGQQPLRVIIAWYKPGIHLATPDINDLLAQTATTSMINMTSEYKTDTRKYWNIVYDRVLNVGFNTTSNSTSFIVKSFKFGKMGKKIKYFNGSTTDTTQNQLYMFYVTNTGSPLLSYRADLRYIDP